MAILSSEPNKKTVASSPTSVRGLIFNIQRFSIQDGPGIRTTVFMKGCSLKCQWCSNPESQDAYQELTTFDSKCINCDRCIEACPLKAISVADGTITIDRGRCDLCLRCAQVCPSKAIEVIGNYMTADEVVEEVEKDRLFYSNSNGGVSVSGGEPLYQWEFTREILRKCKEKAIHTAIDTSGYAPWSNLDQVLDYVDLVLFDIKHMDYLAHIQGTGVSNELILDNVRRAAKKTRLWLRIPLIPDYNDSTSNIRQISELAIELKVEQVSLMPYHCWGVQKYKKLGREYLMGDRPIPTDEQVEGVKKVIESYGIKVSVGG